MEARPRYVWLKALGATVVIGLCVWLVCLVDWLSR